MVCRNCGCEIKDDARCCVRCGWIVTTNPLNNKLVEEQLRIGRSMKTERKIEKEVRENSIYGLTAANKTAMIIVDGILVILLLLLLIFNIDNAAYIAVAGIIIMFYLLVFQLLFIKADEHWWAVFIPFYNTYVFYKISLGDGFIPFLFLIVCTILEVGAAFLGMPSLIKTVAALESVGELIISIMTCVGLAKRLDTSVILMLLCPIVIIPIAALSDKYTYSK